MVRECISLKRILCQISVFLLVFLAGAGNISAEETAEDAAVTVADDAGLLMEEEADWLKSTAENYRKKAAGMLSLQPVMMQAEKVHRQYVKIILMNIQQVITESVVW